LQLRNLIETMRLRKIFLLVIGVFLILIPANAQKLKLPKVNKVKPPIAKIEKVRVPNVVISQTTLKDITTTGTKQSIAQKRYIKPFLYTSKNALHILETNQSYLRTLNSDPIPRTINDEHPSQKSIRGMDVEGTQANEEVTNNEGIQKVEEEDSESDHWWNSIYDLIKTTMPNLKVYLEAETNTYSLLIYDYGYQYEDAA